MQGKLLKRALLFFGLTLFLGAAVYGQQPDSTKPKLKTVGGKTDSSKFIKSNDSTRTISVAKQLKGFIDKNVNGIDDRKEKKMAKGKQNGKKDQFIDRNGDGICDGKESALSIKKAYRKRKGAGK